MGNFAITKAVFTAQDMDRIDKRFLSYIEKWQIVEQYAGSNVVIPDGVSSTITPFNYYEVVDKPDQTQNEKQLSLWCGWQDPTMGNYDQEVIINLRIAGTDVLLTNGQGVVSAEILKSGGAPMQVTFNGKPVTTFTDTITVPASGWFCPARTIQVTNGYQTVANMASLL